MGGQRRVQSSMVLRCISNIFIVWKKDWCCNFCIMEFIWKVLMALLEIRRPTPQAGGFYQYTMSEEQVRIVYHWKLEIIFAITRLKCFTTGWISGPPSTRDRQTTGRGWVHCWLHRAKASTGDPLVSLKFSDQFNKFLSPSFMPC